MAAWLAANEDSWLSDYRSGLLVAWKDSWLAGWLVAGEDSLLDDGQHRRIDGSMPSYG